MRRWWMVLGAPVRIGLLLVLAGSLFAVAPVGPLSPVLVVADDDGEDDGEDDDDGQVSENRGSGGDDDDGGDDDGGGDDDDGDDDNSGRGGGGDESAPVRVTRAAEASPTSTPASLALRTPTAVVEAATGTLLINVRLCPGPAADVTDWAQECAEPVADARFDLEAKDGTLTGWHRDLGANARGEARLEELPVGRYGLDQVGADWCHAESDDVDENGDVRIADGATTTVWIYDCTAEAPK